MYCKVRLLCFADLWLRSLDGSFDEDPSVILGKGGRLFGLHLELLTHACTYGQARVHPH